MILFHITVVLMDAYTGLDMSLLPPCRDALILDLKRTNYDYETLV